MVLPSTLKGLRYARTCETVRPGILLVVVQFMSIDNCRSSPLNSNSFLICDNINTLPHFDAEAEMAEKPACQYAKSGFFSSGEPRNLTSSSHLQRRCYPTSICFPPRRSESEKRTSIRLEGAFRTATPSGLKANTDNDPGSCDPGLTLRDPVGVEAWVAAPGKTICIRTRVSTRGLGRTKRPHPARGDSC